MELEQLLAMCVFKIVSQVTYLLSLADEAWEALDKSDLVKKKAWLADLAATWATILYGQQHEESRMWNARAAQLRKESIMKKEMVNKTEDGKRESGTKKSGRAHGKVKRRF